MAYEESSFLNGLAAGLSATYAQRRLPPTRYFTDGTSRLRNYGLPKGDYDTFVIKLVLNEPTARIVEFEYGPEEGPYRKDFRRAPGSTELQTLYFVTQIPEALPMERFRCNAYFYEPPGARTPFQASFMAFPHTRSGVTRAYPGRPEEVNYWLSRTSRGFPI